MNDRTAKFSIGDTVEVVADVVMKGQTGKVRYVGYDFQYEEHLYLLDTLFEPEVTDKNSRLYRVGKSSFCESWLGLADSVNYVSNCCGASYEKHAGDSLEALCLECQEHCLIEKKLYEYER